MLDLDVRDPRLSEVIDADQELAVVASGFEFVEGPIWHSEYQSLMFSDILGNTIYSWRADTGALKRNTNSHMANGNSYDTQGRLLTCEHATSRVSRTNLATGDYEVMAAHYHGKQLNSPNDIVVDRQENIYFTDPTSGRSAAYGVPREPELAFSGVYRLDSETDELTQVVADFEKPNGLCFSNDGKRLFVSDTVCFHIRVFDVMPDGSLQNGLVWAETTGSGSGVPDGLKIDRAGNIYSCGPGGVHIFNSEGHCLGVIRMPEPCTNFCFGGVNLGSLFITASTSVYRIAVRVPGYPPVIFAEKRN